MAKYNSAEYWRLRRERKDALRRGDLPAAESAAARAAEMASTRPSPPTGWLGLMRVVVEIAHAVDDYAISKKAEVPTTLH